jgi:DNA polymerase-1
VRLRDSGLDATMLLQIHDELIFEVRATQMRETADLVRLRTWRTPSSYRCRWK